MARITVEDCLSQVNNRFTLIHMAAKRVRQLRKGAEPTVASKNKDIVVSLREIAAGKVRKGEKGQEASLAASQPVQVEALLGETDANASINENAAMNENAEKNEGESSAQDS
jgi:DNA-directed RNA polymerase subunit omega